MLPLEGNYDKMIDRMKTAGYEAVVAEFERQFNEYTALMDISKRQRNKGVGSQAHHTKVKKGEDYDE